MATILEHSKISPATEYSASEFSLPMVFFDIIFYQFSTPNVLFYDFPCTKSHFLEKIVPHLKSSLSLTLSQFLPLAGNIIHPLTPGDKPVLNYKAGDSVSFTVSESNADFNHLTGNHPRDCDEFYSFVPNLPPATHSESSIACPVLAVQVTLFPGQGLCIGSVIHHAVADASTIACFAQAWALINRNMPNGADYMCNRLKQSTDCFSSFDRKTLMNPNGSFSIYWDRILQFSRAPEPPKENFPINKVRATFVLKKDEIQKLKNFLLDKCPRVPHLSSFTIICALVWVCWVKSAEEEAADDEPEYFGFSADCRGRLSPPLPANYFGNCLILVYADLKHREVKASDGFVLAAEAIGEAIKENVYNFDEGILRGAPEWMNKSQKRMGKRQLRVSGSPKFDFYGVDFGWGQPIKYEILSIDRADCISLCRSRDFQDGVEISLSRTTVQIDAFTKVITEVLSNLLE